MSNHLYFKQRISELRRSPLCHIGLERFLVTHHGQFGGTRTEIINWLKSSKSSSKRMCGGVFTASLHTEKKGREQYSLLAREGKAHTGAEKSTE